MSLITIYVNQLTVSLIIHMNDLNKIEIEQYSRHFNLPGFGREQQIKLKTTKVLVIGAGGLGVPVLQYLAAAGIGNITIMDGDTVDMSNLHRQVMYRFGDVGKSKAELAAHWLSAQNISIHVTSLVQFITVDNALSTIMDHDIIVDCTDNFPTRYLVNDACVLSAKPLVYGSVYQYEGQVALFNHQGEMGCGPNYRDLYPLPPKPSSVPNCAEGGVLGVLPGIIGSIQALETIKLAAGLALGLDGKLLLFDSLNCQSKIIRLKKNKDIKIDRLINYEEFCGVTTLSKALQMNEITVIELKSWQDSGKDFQLVDVREQNERDFVNIEGTHIPLADILSRADEVSKDKDIVLMCRSGKRSAAALSALASQGYNRLYNLKGGILAWADEIDPSLPKY
jgi:adenylyltransferase/sulfurtransferase